MAIREKMQIAFKKNKKAAFFTIIAIILSLCLLFFYISSNRHSLKDQASVVQSRILSMDSFISDIEHDINRGLYISSMRSLIAMSEYTVTNGSFIPNFKGSFNEIMMNGTITNHTLNITKDSNFGTWLAKIDSQAEKLDLSAEFENVSIDIYHISPWQIEIAITARLNLTDNKQLASWDRHINVSTRLMITDYEDPLYTIYTKGKLTNKIILFNQSLLTVQDTIKYANSSSYIAVATAPSFLMRLAGNLSPSEYGIESIVNIPNLQVAAPEMYKPSAIAIDYLYFNSTLSDCVVNETKDTIPWFRLNETIAPDFNVHCS